MSHLLVRCVVLFIISFATFGGIISVCHGEATAEPPVKEQKRSTLRIPVPDPDVQSAQHPLVPVINYAVESYKYIRRDIRDYTTIVVRRERVDGRLGDHEFLYAKVRNRQVRDGKVVVPFSVYMKFLKPNRIKGREVLYVEGANNGQMFARNGGKRFAFVTTQLLPESDLAMQGNRYPITEFGIENLSRRLIENAREETKFPCTVDYLPDAKINGRPTTGIVVRQLNRQPNARFQVARIFVDNQLNLPVHYEAYGWSDDDGGPPVLLEKYSYTKLQLNVGLTDADFDPTNPQYQVK